VAHRGHLSTEEYRKYRFARILKHKLRSHTRDVISAGIALTDQTRMVGDLPAALRDLDVGWIFADAQRLPQVPLGREYLWSASEMVRASNFVD
jgi:hypothetical protein